MEMFNQSRDLLQARALQARHEGVHHSGYLVGAAALVVDADGEYDIVVGANFKPETGSVGPRLCAEEYIYDLQRLMSCRLIVGFVIAAPPKDDDMTGKSLNGTLPPCIHCRRKFSQSIELDEPIRRRTYFESMRVDTDKGPNYVDKVEGATIGDILTDFGAD